MRSSIPPWLGLFTSVARVAADSGQTPLTALSQYTFGQAIPVSCLNRTVDTGEHITDEKGQLQYIPFATCNETGRPLELYFGVEKGQPPKPMRHSKQQHN